MPPSTRKEVETLEVTKDLNVLLEKDESKKEQHWPDECCIVNIPQV